MRRLGTLLTLLLATTSLADAQRPRIAVHPLVLEGVDSKKDRDDLTALLPGIVIVVGKVEIASPSDVDAELKKKGQAFCTAESLFKCLAYLADHTSSAHAMRIELRRGGRAGEWELLANVIRVDGFVERQPDIFRFTQPDSVKLVPIARTKLEEFIGTLKLGTLPLAPPVKADPPIAVIAPKPDIPPNVEFPGVERPPPPPPHQESIAPMRVTAYLASAATVVSLGVAAGLAVSARIDAGALSVTNGNVRADQLGLAKGIDTKLFGATVCLVVGLVAASTAVTLFVVSSSDERTTSLVPVPFPGGGAVMLSSSF